MRRFAVVALAAVAAVLALPVGSARAGGPTSVLVVNYDTSRAAAALTGSDAYNALTDSLDAMSTPTGETREPGQFMETSIRLTWLIHDVTPWRIDGVFVDGDGLWVSTTTSHDGQPLFEQDPVWHQPKDPALLRKTLEQLGILGPEPRVPAAALPSAAPAAASTAGPPVAEGGNAATPAALTTEPSRAAGWVTFAGGTALGVLASLLAGTALVRRRRGGPHPGDGAAPEPPTGAPAPHLSANLPTVAFTSEQVPTDGGRLR